LLFLAHSIPAVTGVRACTRLLRTELNFDRAGV
jgi:hypothetical protein